MSKRLRPYFLSGLLLIVTSFLGALLTGEWLHLRQQRLHGGQNPSAPAATPAEPELAADDFALPNISQYQQMVERPLFMESRRPSQPAPPEPPAPPKLEPPPPISFKLMGILATPQGKMALVADAKGKYKRLKVRDALDGWQIVDIKPDRVLLDHGGNREDLALLKKRPPGAAPTPTPAAAPGEQPPQRKPGANRPVMRQPPQPLPLPPQGQAMAPNMGGMLPGGAEAIDPGGEQDEDAEQPDQ